MTYPNAEALNQKVIFGLPNIHSCFIEILDQHELIWSLQVYLGYSLGAITFDSASPPHVLEARLIILHYMVNFSFLNILIILEQCVIPSLHSTHSSGRNRVWNEEFCNSHSWIHKSKKNYYYFRWTWVFPEVVVLPRTSSESWGYDIELLWIDHNKYSRFCSTSSQRFLPFFASNCSVDRGRLRNNGEIIIFLIQLQCCAKSSKETFVGYLSPLKHNRLICSNSQFQSFQCNHPHLSTVPWNDNRSAHSLHALYSHRFSAIQESASWGGTIFLPRLKKSKCSKNMINSVNLRRSLPWNGPVDGDWLPLVGRIPILQHPHNRPLSHGEQLIFDLSFLPLIFDLSSSGHNRHRRRLPHPGWLATLDVSCCSALARKRRLSKIR